VYWKEGRPGPVPRVGKLSSDGEDGAEGLGVGVGRRRPRRRKLPVKATEKEEMGPDRICRRERTGVKGLVVRDKDKEREGAQEAAGRGCLKLVSGAQPVRKDFSISRARSDRNQKKGGRKKLRSHPEQGRRREWGVLRGRNSWREAKRAAPFEKHH